MKKMIGRNTLTLLTTILLSCSATELPAYKSSWVNDSAPWLGGALFGAATGAIAGWAVCQRHHSHGSKGDKGDKGDNGHAGPKGPMGPQGAMGLEGPQGASFVFTPFETNTTNQLVVSYTNLSMDDELVYSVTLLDPIGQIVFQERQIDSSFATPLERLFPPAYTKLEGEWRLVIEIIQDASNITYLGEFTFQVDDEAPQTFVPQMRQYTTDDSPLVEVFAFHGAEFFEEFSSFPIEPPYDECDTPCDDSDQ